jgi:hypothetical protein
MSDSIGILLQPTTRAKKLSAKEVGCQYCPLARVPGIKKIFGTVEGKDIFIWAMCPGKKEKRARPGTGRPERAIAVGRTAASGHHARDV